MALGDCFDDTDDSDKFGPTDTLIRVRFTADAGIYNVVDFKDWSAVWYDILRGFAVATGNAPEEFRFVGASSGSVVAMFAADPVNVAAVVLAVERGLAITNQVLDLKLKATEIKQSPLDSKAIQDAIAKGISQALNNGPEQVAAEIETQFSLEGNDGEQKNALRHGIGKMFEFFDKGGEVDFVVPKKLESEPTEEDFKIDFERLDKIREGVESIRSEERKKQLLI